MDELKEVAIWAWGDDRSLGPDDFTFKFLKAYWNVVIDDVFCFLKGFEERTIISKGSMW